MPQPDLPVTIEIPAGTLVRISGGRLEKSAAVMEKQATDGAVLLGKGHKYTVKGVLDTDAGEQNIDIAIIRGI